MDAQKILDRALLFDLETEPIETGRNFLPRMHCMVWKTLHDGGEVIGHDEVVKWWVDRTKQDDFDGLWLIGHNIARFDVPVLEKWMPNRSARLSESPMYDTLVASEAIHGPLIEKRSYAMRGSLSDNFKKQEELFPARFCRRHSLEAWGYRFQLLKKFADVDPKEFFKVYSEDMLARCRSDVELNWRLLRWLLTTPPRPDQPIMSPATIEWESRLAYIVGVQERHGFGLDLEGAHKLEAQLTADLGPLATQLGEAFGGWYAPRSGQKLELYEGPEMGDYGGVIQRENGQAKFDCPKKTTRRRPSTKLNPHPWPHIVGGPHTKVAFVEYNAGSSAHRIKGLQRKYDWKHDPDEVTDTGQPSMTDDVLKQLTYPEIPLLREYSRKSKMLSQLGGGKESWLKHAVPALETKWGGVCGDGVGQWGGVGSVEMAESKTRATIHGKVNVVGARTFRMTHSRPNTANVDGAPEMRRLWRPVSRNWKQLGVDASGLELRCLANRLYPYDGGVCAEIVLKGRAEDGTDIHSRWRDLSGLFYREHQKTFNYAMLYGAGAEKLAKTVIGDWVEALENGLTDKPLPSKEMAMEYAKEAKARILVGMPALAQLLDKISEAYNEREWVRGMHGHIICMNTEHGGLNDVLQSDGGLVMKEALRIFWGNMKEECGKSWNPMGNIHDEWQMEVRTEEEAHQIGAFAVKCIAQAGGNFKFHVPLDGTVKVGETWADTH